MVECKKLIPVVLATVAVAMAQFDAPIDPYSLANTPIKQQNRTLSSYKNYNALTRSGMAIGLIDVNEHLVSFDLGVSGQKLASGDSLLLKNIAVQAPRFTVGRPGRVAFTGYYGIVPLTSKSSPEVTLTMPQHRFGGALAIQEEHGNFRFAMNLDGFGGKSMYEETGDSGRAILGADNLGISFGTAPHKLFSMDVGVFASGYIDTLFGTQTHNVDGQEKMIRQERIANIELPRISTHIRIGDTLVPVLSNFDFSYGKKHFVYANRASNAQNAGNEFGMDLTDSEWPNLDPIVTDSIRWSLANSFYFVPVKQKLEINPSFDLGFMHDRNKRMNPSEDNHPMSYDGERSGYKWETTSFRFGLGLDFLLANCVDYWTEFGHSNLKLDLTGEEISKLGENHEEKFNRFATGAELAFHDIPNMKFPSSGELFFDLSFMSLNESAMFQNYYGTAQYRHFTDITTTTQAWRYMPWVTIKERVKTTDFTLGLRGTVKDQLLEMGGRIHFLKQTHSNEIGSQPILNGPKFDLMFTYNLTEKAFKERVK